MDKNQNSISNELSSKVIVHLIPNQRTLIEDLLIEKSSPQELVVSKIGLQQEENNLKRISVDYVHENEKHTSGSVLNISTSWICSYVAQEINFAIYSLGDSAKGEFLFGSENQFRQDSYFYFVYNVVVSSLKSEFDVILIDYYKIRKNNYLVDFVSSYFISSEKCSIQLSS